MNNSARSNSSRDSASNAKANSDLPAPPFESNEKLYAEMDSSPEGLTDAQVSERQAKFGLNELTEEKISPILKFLSYFWGPIPWMIEVAIILSLLVKHYADFIIILALLLMNGLVGFWEEYEAGNAIAALKAKLALQARVKRNGAWSTIASKQLVPGDIIRLRMGDIIPADARLLAGDPIEVDQSALTGESLPVSHESGDTVYSGSIIKQGEIDAIIASTGSSTYFGKTARLMESAHTVSHFQKAVLKIGDYLIVIALALVILILFVALFRGDPILTTLQFALILTVAAVPVAMPAVLSVTMAAGSKTLAKKNAIVSRLASTEELAGMDILCSDKTGTLTKNQLTLGDTFSVEGVQANDVILCGALASNLEDNDPIDLAVTKGLSDEGVLKDYEVMHFQPFDPVHKRTEAELRDKSGRSFKVTKGAVEIILAISSNRDAVERSVDAAVEGFAARGFRALGVARADDDGTWKFLGVLPLYDPPRDDSKETIETAEQMGVKVKMVTGDQLIIAKEIAKELDIGTNILDAKLFGDAKHYEAAHMNETIEHADGFAQVFPEHKYHIVDVLQKEGHIVGMTGDGVNDAPALKKADAGIAVSGATDAARSAADIVLLTPGLSVIIDAIKESRKIFQRMNSYAIYRISETIRVLLFMTLSILVFNFYPVTAVMIVLLALLNDGAILSIAYDNTRYSNEPEKWNMPIVLGISTVLGVAGVIASFLLFYLAEKVFHLSQNQIQTLIFLKLAVAGHLTIFVTRTRGRFWSIAPSPILFWSAVGTKILATLAAVYGFLMTPIGWNWSLLVWGYALIWFVVNDQIKISVYKIFDHKLSLLTTKKHE